ncbi:SHOCT domain-containing protein [Sulfurovum sp.]|uniref:SHOCT domain-containing protein n=1 Tax=Sulfurovum sp. TaxID=1969726 RepID=UPI003569D334
MDYVGHGWGMGFGMWFTLILFIVIVFYFLTELTKNKEKHSSAQDILDRRYANGEIDTEEYEEKSNALKKND